MWTNVFRIGGLHHITWFQFLPFESDSNSLPEKSVRTEQRDAATLIVISSHLQLQKDGFLSTWTNSFVGPWDPSQGIHNPDEKIKLWLFLPGRHHFVVEQAQAAVSRLRVVGSGLWLAPGDSEEVAVALSQALRNCIERALKGLSYVRFGDVFSRCQSFAQSETNFRRVQPTCEFIFAASEEAIYVHALIYAKHIRSLSSDDMERVIGHRSNDVRERLQVIVSPHGMLGRLTGCCPSDLVKQVYFSKGKASNGIAVLGTPFHVAQSNGCQLRGHNCYVEVTLGCISTGTDKAFKSDSKSYRNGSKHHPAEPPAVVHESGEQKQGLFDNFPVRERAFIYPAETVMVPVIPMAFARTSLKRFWLQNWVGKSMYESWHCMGSIESLDGPLIRSNGIRPQHSYNSSSNSNSSSISSTSSTSSDSDYRMAGTGELEADADSLTCRQSGLTSNDDNKMVSKRPRTSITESHGQAGTVISTANQQAYGSVEANNSTTTGVANDQMLSHWDWDDDDRGQGVDIQTLLSEFGDFGDFFEDDVLAFGEPPGTAESQALIFSVADCGDVSSPCTGGMDISDQTLLPGLGFPSFEGFTQPPLAVMEEAHGKIQEFTKDARSSGAGSHLSVFSTGEFDYFSKAEAMMTFAPEYTAVETPASEFSTSIFRSPYLPRSRKVDTSHSSSNFYVYGATPPSPLVEISDEKHHMSLKEKSGPRRRDACSLLQHMKYYTHVQSGKNQFDKRVPASSNRMACKVEPSSLVSGFTSSSALVSLQKKMSENPLEAGYFFLSLRTVLATEVECIMFQAAMCRLRHMPLSSSNTAPKGYGGLTGSTVLDQGFSDTSTMVDMMCSKYDVVKKECIPVRIAGDVDGTILDGQFNAPVGVWRSVGVPKGTKPSNTHNIDSAPSMPHNTIDEEDMVMSGQRQPLQELLDAMALLVQQSTSFVDLSLDGDYGDGPYGWLALQEQQRRGFSCGPSMVHAGCGGLLSACHSLDIAGVELVDPLSADVHASSVINLLQSDIKVALKSAFGNLDGPLSVTDWCKGRSQSGDAGTPGDGFSVDCSVNEAKDSSSGATLGEPISPPLSSTGVSSCLKDGARPEDSSQRRSNQDICNSELSEQQLSNPRFKPTLVVLPLPAILVGYQDDWLKTSANSLQLWEKAPLEPYALPKPISYHVVCPDIDPLTSAAADFFLQLGTVYETCKLGTHSPQIIGGQMELAAGKWLSSGFVLIDCPQSIKIGSSNVSVMGSISDYLLALSKGWDLRSFLKSLAKALKNLRLGSNSTVNHKEGSGGPCTVIYVVCPFPEASAVLQTVIESCAALGSTIFSSDKERRSLLHGQVEKALSSSVALDEASISNVITLSGFSTPKLVLQIVTVEAILRVSRPALNELVVLKEIAFTVYNKARRIPRAFFNDIGQSSTVSGRSQPSMMHMTSTMSGLWKDCVAPRMAGQPLPREGELDSGLRPGNWDNSWQTSRTGGLNCDRPGEASLQDDVRYLFEPLFILAEPGSAENGVSPTMFGNAVSESSSSRPAADDSPGSYVQSSMSSGSMDVGSSTLLDRSEPDGFGSNHQKIASLHCCYGWTEDWRWLVCIWTDSRGELLDGHIFPFGGISSRQDTKGLQSLFVQVLHQGCQLILSSSPDVGTIKPRDIVITRIGCFYELECQEWQKAIYAVGGNEVKKWPLQLRRSVPDGVSSSSNGASLQQQEMSMIQERNLPSSPSPSLYSPQSKSSSFMKGGLGQTSTRKQLLGGQTAVDSSRGLLQWVQSISLVGVSIDHSLNLIYPADMSSTGGGTQSGSSVGQINYLEGFSPVKSLGSTSVSYILIPSPSIRYLPPTPMQLPTCLTAESPPLAHLLHSKGSAIPLSTGFVVSKAVPSVRRDPTVGAKEEWPSVLSVSLIDYYGGNNSIQEKLVRGSGSKQGRSFSSEARDYESETHLILESITAELHALSWLTVSPAYLDRRTALPFHCDMLLRLRRLLHYADGEYSENPERTSNFKRSE